MELVSVTKENIHEEHICCAIAKNNDCQVMAKKGWMLERFEEGLHFIKGNLRGKCFIEFLPAEHAWCPIVANDYMYIDCLWVSGQFKGQGYSNKLLDACIKTSKEEGKKGIVVLSSKKKRGFLSDKNFFLHKGFSVCDTAQPDFELLYLPFTSDTDKPQFMEHARTPHVDKQGFVLYYADQCPYTAKYVPLLRQAAKDKEVAFDAIHITTTDEAKNAPAPVTSFCLFYNGTFLTNEIQSVKKFEKLMDEVSAL